MTGERRARRAWQALGAFWALVLAGSLGTVLVLDHLGPPGPPAVALGEAAPASVPAAPPPPEEKAAPAQREALAVPAPSPDPGLMVAPLAPAPEPAAPAAPPEAPPPPPLPALAAEPDSATSIPPPDPALQELSPFGPLPRIAPDGRQPRQVYARPFDTADSRPRIALVLGGLGVSTTRSEEAIRRLPPAVTLGFNPLVARPDLLLEQARRRGIEVVMALPLESAGSEPADALLSPGLTWMQNRDRLYRALGRFAGYAGTLGALGGERGERFAADAVQLTALQEELRRRGLFYLDPRPHAPRPAVAWGATADLILDEPLTRGEVEHRLEVLEQLARERGSAIGLAGEPAPLLVDRIIAWADGLPQRGLVLAPLSAVVHPPQDDPASAPER
ncbi:MAG TPA: divergent polysaccharide deacetylase family protein [Roseomonas sp.]|nr:divergent polysaccharide deacetylase family protein [Roseomonas sp.]